MHLSVGMNGAVETFQLERLFRDLLVLVQMNSNCLQLKPSVCEPQQMVIRCKFVKLISLHLDWMLPCFSLLLLNMLKSSW